MRPHVLEKRIQILSHCIDIPIHKTRNRLEFQPLILSIIHWICSGVHWFCCYALEFIIYNDRRNTSAG